jgi:hypothetical protein
LKPKGPAHVLVEYARILHAIGGVRTLEGRARLLTLLGASLGRLKGSIQARTLYL